MLIPDSLRHTAKPSILLISPIDGPIGGILYWTKTIHAYYNSLESPNVKLSVFNFCRKRSGQLARNFFIRFLTGFVDYYHLTKDAIQSIKSSSADIVHIASPGTFLLLKDIILSSVAKKCGKKVVIHFHFGRIPEVLSHGWWERALLKIVLRGVDMSVVMDKDSFDALVAHGYQNVINLPNPISHSLIDNNDALQRLRNNILFVGHVIPTKGIVELVKACASLKSVKLDIVGCVAADYREYLISVANDNHFSNIHFFGEITHVDAVRHMSECAVFVLPSYTEGFPNVILESMACSCAIVATSVGAIPQMLNIETPGKECGIVVPPKNVKELSEAISRMLTDTEFADNCRKNAKERLLENYTVSKVWDQLENMWSSVIFVS